MGESMNSAEGEGSGGACVEQSAQQHPSGLTSLLELQRAQLTALRADGQERLNELSEAFKVMAAALKAPAGAEDESHVKLSADAIVQTLQFADNQAQRLEHLIRALDQMSALVGSSQHIDDASWNALRSGIRADYTMARECEVYDGLFGVPVEPVHYAQKPAASESSIELF